MRDIAAHLSVAALDTTTVPRLHRRDRPHSRPGQPAGACVDGDGCTGVRCWHPPDATPAQACTTVTRVIAAIAAAA
jgi:hypothetical protein